MILMRNYFFPHTYNENNAHYVYRYKPQNGAINKDVIHAIKIMCVSITL